MTFFLIEERFCVILKVLNILSDQRWGPWQLLHAGKSGLPTFFVTNGKLLLPSKKSDLFESLQNLSSTSTNVPASFDAIVFDVLTFLHHTFNPSLQYCLILDVVLGKYNNIPDSLKKATRNSRDSSVSRRVQCSTVVPKNWRDFLRVDAEKELFIFLAEKVPPIDTDFDVICTAAFHSLACTELWILFGTGANYRTFAINDRLRNHLASKN